jgi:hypothetical protein
MDEPLSPDVSNILLESEAIENHLNSLMRSNTFQTGAGVGLILIGLLDRLIAVHGRVEAHRLLAAYAGPQEKNDINRLKGWALLERFDAMPVKNVRGLSRQIYEENAKLAEDKRLTPRPRPELTAIEAYLRELLRQRREECQAGTWQGPIDPVNGPFLNPEAFIDSKSGS